jgi:hypothetical protein
VLLRNAHATITRGAARLLIGSVIDFAARMSDPEARPRPDLSTDVGLRQYGRPRKTDL